MKKVGVILARLQPVHKGHLALIRKSFLENDETYILIGSADKFGQRNPIPIGLRMQLLRGALEEEFDGIIKQSVDENIYTSTMITGSKTIKIVPLDDLSDESENNHEWGFYLYSKVVGIASCPNFTMYYSDGFEIITSWFPGFILRNNVSLCLIARNGTEDGISATAVRKAIEDGDDEKLSKYVTGNVMAMKDTIRQHIEISKLVK